MKASERLWLTADGDRVVAEDDPDAAYLFAAEGDELDSAEAKRLGVRDGKAPAKR